MLIECPHCDARVHGKVLSEREYPPTDDVDPYKYILLECPSCHSVLLGYSDYEFFPGGWSPVKRLWPDPPNDFDASIPLIVQRSIDEATRCLRARAYSACAVMCGRAVEAICVEKAGESNLARGLKKLRDEGIIDERLYSWGEALRQERNLGAHASEETHSKEDARDILDFANAIIEYIYVMTARFMAYQARKRKKKDAT